MSEEEEFEFRRRFEAEQQAKSAPIEKVESVGKAPFLAQVGRGMMDVYQGGKQLGLNTLSEMGIMEDEAADYNKQLAEEIKTYNKNNPDFQGGRLLGAVATPISMLPMAAATLPARVGLGAAAGTVAGATQPVVGDDYWGKKGEQALIGGTVGAVLPAAITGAAKTGGAGIEFAKPFFKKGVTADIAKYMRDIAGPDREKIQRILQQSQGDETVQQTLGRSVRESVEGGDPKLLGARLAKLEDELSRSRVTESSIAQRKLAQETGRAKDIGKIAGTSADRKTAETARAAAGADNYKDAFNLAVQGDDELARIFENPYIKSQLSKVDEIAESAANRGKKTGLTEYLHDIKTGLDAKLKIPSGKEGALDKSGRNEVKEVQKELVSWMETKNPFYEKARLEHIELSKPMNKMAVGRELEKALINPADEEAAKTFQTAIREAPRTLKKASGDARYNELGEVLDPPQVSTVKRVGDALLDKQYGERLSKGKTGSLGELGSEIEISLPNLLSRPVMAANFILKTIGKDKSPEYQKVAEALMLNPKNMAKALEMPRSSPQWKVANAIMSQTKKSSILGAAQASAGGY